MQDDSSKAHRRGRGYLPHWELANATYFVPFRLADSLPQQATERLQEERRTMELRARGRLDQLTEAQRALIDTVITSSWSAREETLGERRAAYGVLV